MFELRVCLLTLAIGGRCDLVFNPDKKSGFSRLYSSQKTPIDTVVDSGVWLC